MNGFVQKLPACDFFRLITIEIQLFVQKPVYFVPPKQPLIVFQDHNKATYPMTNNVHCATTSITSDDYDELKK
jgi:hypothetical protein